MRYGSVCSGIEAASVAWPDWDCAFVAEVDPFASAVLEHRYPAVPNLGDITAEDFCDRAIETGPIDVLIGGTPCQSFSVAGGRAGLDDPRGQLSLSFVAIVDRVRPRYVIWENVPGVLSSGGGRDFGAFIGALADCGYRLAYRVLDAQFFGVAQRRKRVFVVGCSGDGDPAEILALREGLSGDPAPCRETGENPASPSTGRAGGSRQAIDENRETFPCIDANMDRKWGSNQWVDRGQYVHEVASTIPRSAGHHGRSSPRGDGSDNLIVTDMRGNGDGQVVPTLVGDHLNRPTDYTPMVADTLRTKEGASAFRGDGTDNLVVADPIVAKEGGTYTHEGANNFRLRNCVIDEQQVTSKANRTQPAVDHAPPLTQAGRHLCWPDVAMACMNRDHKGPRNYHDGGLQATVAPNPASIRRLTPRECERLQGFPDDWTLIPWTHGKPAADTPRYKAIGNSMAVPVIRWIGERLASID